MKRVRAILIGAVLLAAALPASASAWQPGPERFGVGEETEVPVTMKDGTELRANVYFPTDPETGEAAKGDFPVVINFTPYGKTALAFLGEGDGGLESLGDASGLARPLPELVTRGYINVIADIRGTGSSQGSFGLLNPQQGADGAELVRWAAKLPNSNGRVGMYGPSYMAIIQYLTAAKLGPKSPLDAMVPVAVPNDPYRELFAFGGMPALETDLPLFLVFAGLPALWPLVDEAPSDLPSAVALELARLNDIVGQLLPLGVEVLTGGDRSYRGEWWAERSPAAALRKVVENKIPVLSFGGWKDVFQRGPLTNWAGLQNLARGRPQTAKPTVKLRPSRRYHVFQGPWTHLNQGRGFPMADLAHRWFDRHLKGDRSAQFRGRRTVNFVDQTTGEWHKVRRYPFPRQRHRRLYFGPGDASGGTLQRNPAAKSGSDQVLNLVAGVPCTGTTDQGSLGAISLIFDTAGIPFPCNADNGGAGTGPVSRSYETKPFPKPRAVAGPLTASIVVESNRPETYLVAHVEDVAPDGTSEPLSSGALLGSFRAVDGASSWRDQKRDLVLPDHPFSRESAAPVPVGKPVRMDIEIFPTAATIERAHRLGLTLTTANLPHSVPTASQASGLVGGTYEISFGGKGGSYLNAPLVPAERLGKVCRLCSKP